VRDIRYSGSAGRVPERFLLPSECVYRLAAAIVTAVLSVGAREAPVPPRNRPPMTCVESWPESIRAARGYDHYVKLYSRCKTPARCEVSSNSNPSPRRVVVVPRRELRVLIFRSSPDRHFVPHVLCRIPPPGRPLSQPLAARTVTILTEPKRPLRLNLRNLGSISRR
jgi:hypothetical protein